MTFEDFDKIVEDRLVKIKAILLSKRKEYAGGGKDRLHNFIRAAALLGCSREQALIGMFTKHMVSILDIVDNFQTEKPTIEMVEEKCGDALNYLILLEAMMKEDIMRT